MKNLADIVGVVATTVFQYAGKGIISFIAFFFCIVRTERGAFELRIIIHFPNSADPSRS